MAGLMLLPENSAATLRLEAVAHAAASLAPAPDRPTIKARRLLDLLNMPPLAPSSLSVLEDPSEQAFSDVLVLGRQAHVVLTGRDLEAVARSRHLLSAIFDEVGSPAWKRFQSQALPLTEAVLRLSGEVAHRAGISRGVVSLAEVPGRVTVPGSAKLAELRGAVRFSPAELDALLRPHGLQASTLEALVQRQGQEALDEFTPFAFGLLDRPLVRGPRGEITVALPHHLLGALRSCLQSLALAHGMEKELASRFHAAARRSVESALWRLGSSADPMQPFLHDFLRPPDLRQASSGLFRLDRDKAVVLLLLTDDFRALSPAGDTADWLPADWLPAEAGLRIAAWVPVIEQRFRELSAPPGQLLFLFVFQSHRRLLLPTLPEDARPASPHLLLTAAGLSAIAGVDANHALTLFEFARDRAALTRAEFARLPTALDEFTFWCRHGHAYPQVDPETPWHLAMDTNQNARALKEALAADDLHVAVAPEGGLPVAVFRRDADPPLRPVYLRDVDERSTGYALLVEAGPLPLWLTAPGRAPVDRGPGVDPVGDYSRLLADGAAFWMCRLAGAAPELWRTLARSHPHVIVHFSRRFLPDRAPFLVRVVRADARVEVALTPAADSLFLAADNRGERQLMLLLLRACSALLPGDGASLDEGQISRLVDAHLPPGPAKRVLIIRPGLTPVLCGAEPPPPRLLQPVWVTRVRRESAARATEFLGTPEATVRGKRAKELLNAVVERLFGRLEAAVAGLNADGLLELHLGANEALLHADGLFRLRTPPQAAIFGTDSHLHTHAAEWASRRDLAAVAGRFVLEYLAARPPAGTRAASVGSRDELLALAAAILEHGVESDLIDAELADFELTVLPQRGLVHRGSKYPAASRRYQALRVDADLADLSEGFAEHWRTACPEPPGAPSFNARLEEALRSDTGFTLSELTAFFAAVHGLGEGMELLVKRVTRERFRRELGSALGWPDARVAAALGAFSLGPRAGFFSPPSPFGKNDVYPRRYQRALSLLRRPLIRRLGAGGVEEVLWGNRQVVVAAGFLQSLCEAGLLPTRTPAAKELMSRVRNDYTDAFEKQVAALLRGGDRFLVRAPVHKLGGLDLHRTPEDLGDIDVLAADRRHRRLWLLECKAIALGRVPHEIRGELQDLFVGKPSSGKASMVERHLRRLRWAREHRQEILLALGLDPTVVWRVEAMVVTRERLFAPHLRHSPLPVVCLEDLLDALGR